MTQPSTGQEPTESSWRHSLDTIHDSVNAIKVRWSDPADSGMLDIVSNIHDNLSRLSPDVPANQRGDSSESAVLNLLLDLGRLGDKIETLSPLGKMVVKDHLGPIGEASVHVTISLKAYLNNFSVASASTASASPAPTEAKQQAQTDHPRWDNTVAIHSAVNSMEGIAHEVFTSERAESVRHHIQITRENLNNLAKEISSGYGSNPWPTYENIYAGVSTIARVIRDSPDLTLRLHRDLREEHLAAAVALAGLREEVRQFMNQGPPALTEARGGTVEAARGTSASLGDRVDRGRTASRASSGPSSRASSVATMRGASATFTR